LFSFSDGRRADTLCGHGNKFALRNNVGTRKTAIAASCQDVCDAKGLAQRTGPVKIGLTYEQGLVSR